MKMSEKFIPNKLGIAAICNRKGVSDRTHLISMNNMNFTNEVRNNELFDDYILVDNPQRVDWVRCERTNRINMKFPEGKHFFKVR